MTPQLALQQVLTESNRQREKAKPMASPHEGYGLLADALDGLWISIRSNAPKPTMRSDAKALAATALRFMEDCT